MAEQTPTPITSKPLEPAAPSTPQPAALPQPANVGTPSPEKKS